MSKGELISADEHLASCRECREMLGNREDLGAHVNSLRADLEKSLASEHVEYEQLEAYVDETLGETEREALDSHYKSCALCAAELRDLQAFKNQSGEYRTLWSRGAARDARFFERGLLNQVLLGFRAAWRPANRWALAAFALIALAVGIPVALEWTRKPSIIVHQPDTIPIPIPPIIDKSRETLSARFSYLPPELQAVIANAVANQHIETPFQTPLGATELTVRREEEEGSVPLLTPVGTVVYSNTPVFRWKAISNADGYRVQVRDSRQNPVESSPVVTGTSWKSTAILRRGATYVWQVVTIVGGVEVEESPLDVSQARFKVLDEPHLRQLELVHAEDHFARGILLAHSGVLDEAAQEFLAVAPSDPNHAIAARFEQEARATIVRQQGGLQQ